MHRSAHASLDDLVWTSRRWNGSTAYAESKLHDLMLALAIARRWPEVHSNAVDPGWVPTRMGGRGAPDEIFEEGSRTQVWLAAQHDPAAHITGRLVFHLGIAPPIPRRRRALRSSTASWPVSPRSAASSCPAPTVQRLPVAQHRNRRDHDKDERQRAAFERHVRYIATLQHHRADSEGDVTPAPPAR